MATKTKLNTKKSRRKYKLNMEKRNKMYKEIEKYERNSKA